MSKKNQPKLTQFDEVEEKPIYKKKVKEKKKAPDDIFLTDELERQKANDRWLNKKKNKSKHSRDYDDYDDGWN